MASIGIIANPASGKDIRRLVSYATVIDNNEKVNIVKRIVLAAQAMGVDDIYFMPDTFQIGYNVITSLRDVGQLHARGHILDEIPMTGSMVDSTNTAELMEELGVGSIVVLGGDGTSRAVAKSVVNTPIAPVSTGTNNVYPVMMEGTVVGMAAGAAAMMEDPYSCCIKDKRLEVSVDGELREIALIDAVLSEDLYVGAKAIWDVSRIRRLWVTRCHPASIGFSAIAGSVEVVRDTDDYGFSIVLGEEGHRVRAAVAAGVFETLTVSESHRMEKGVSYSIPIENNCMVALDGERELKVKKGETLSCMVTENGPWRIHTKLAIEKAKERGAFDA